MIPSDPLVLTLELDQESQEFFDRLRRSHFPPERLLVGAHLTLFHALPGERLAELVDDVRAEVSGLPVKPFGLRDAGLQLLGRGVAYRLEAPALAELHTRLQRRWSGQLTRQDAQPLRPHVTVQNKVTPEQARATASLLAGVRPPEMTAWGLRFWHYRGGPWEPADCVRFAAA